MTALAAPNPGNYTLGAHEMLIGGVSVGNIVNATISVAQEDLSHFSAIMGGDAPDPALCQSLSIRIRATLDEPNAVNLKKFFLADSSFRVGMAAPIIDAVTFNGIAIVGNVFSWAIPKAAIKGEGDFGYTTDDWAKFALNIGLLYNALTPTAPFGTITHSGV